MKQHWTVPFTALGDMLRTTWYGSRPVYKDPIPFFTTLKFAKLEKTVNGYPYAVLTNPKGNVFYMFYSDFEYWLRSVNTIVANGDSVPGVRGIYMYVKKGDVFGVRLVSTEIED